MKTILRNMQTRAMYKMTGVSYEEGDHLLEILGTIIIAVVLLIFFRKELVSLFTSAIGKTSNSVNEMFTNAVASTPAGN